MIQASIQLQRNEMFSLNVELSLSNHVTALFGHSGAGKSSVLQVIAGLERGGSKDRISVICNDTRWQDENTYVPPHRRSVGYVFQTPQLFPHLSVTGNLRYGEQRADHHRIGFDQVVDWLDLAPLFSRPVTTLSGGEAQRVAMGRALLSSPRCLLLDEPLGSIDEAGRQRILPYLSRIRSELDIPMIYVTHAIDEVNYLADHVCQIEDGRITAEGNVFDMSTSLDLARTQETNPAAVLDCVVTGYDPHWQLAKLSFGEQHLHVAAGPVSSGQQLRIRIPASDISLSLSHAQDSSILNILPAVIDAIYEDPQRHSVLVRLLVGDQALIASITRQSRERLNLHQGQSVFAQIKGVALMRHHG